VTGPQPGEPAGGAKPAAAPTRAASLPPPRPALRREGEGPQQ